jgi:xylulokinase
MTSVLGIDLGTQHIKVMVYDPDRKQVMGIASSALDLIQNEDGTAEQQAHWWINGLSDALSGIDKKLLSSVAALGVSGQQHGFVPVNNAGKVLAPVKLWCDTSTAKECATIMDRVGGQQKCIELAGNPILPGYTASKLLWFKNTHPTLYSDLDTILLPHDYLNFYLTGEKCMEAGDASGTGFFDVRNRVWADKVLAAIDDDRDLTKCLPNVRTGNGEIGRILPGIAAVLGIPEGIPVSVGGGDNMMGAIGTGNVRPGRLTISLGTSGTLYAYADSPVIDRDGEVAAFCSSTGGWLPLLCTMNCTVSTELVRKMLNSDLAEFEACISIASRGSEGILTVPFFNGERTPNLPQAKGCILGIDSQNSRPENLLRSSVEGATYALRYGIDKLAELNHPADEIVLTGGGVNSPAWRQIVADIFNMPVIVLQQDEGAAFGAALQAAELLCDTPLGLIVDEHLSKDHDLGTLPDSEAVNFYNAAYQRYLAAVDAVTSLYDSSGGIA